MGKIDNQFKTDMYEKIFSIQNNLRIAAGFLDKGEEEASRYLETAIAEFESFRDAYGESMTKVCDKDAKHFVNFLAVSQEAANVLYPALEIAPYDQEMGMNSAINAISQLTNCGLALQESVNAVNETANSKQR